MPVKQKPKEITRVPEEEKVSAWRQERFVAILRKAGMTDEEITLSVIGDLDKSRASPHDLDDLLNKGCKPETAIQILV